MSVTAPPPVPTTTPPPVPTTAPPVTSSSEDPTVTKPDIAAIASATNKRIQEHNAKTAAANAAAAAASVESTAEPETPKETPAASSGNHLGLPVGWKEMIDKKTNRTYYVNT